MRQSPGVRRHPPAVRERRPGAPAGGRTGDRRGVQRAGTGVGCPRLRGIRPRDLGDGPVSRSGARGGDAGQRVRRPDGDRSPAAPRRRPASVAADRPTPAGSSPFRPTTFQPQHRSDDGRTGSRAGRGRRHSTHSGPTARTRCSPTHAHWRSRRPARVGRIPDADPDGQLAALDSTHCCQHGSTVTYGTGTPGRARRRPGTRGASLHRRSADQRQHGRTGDADQRRRGAAPGPPTTASALLSRPLSSVIDGRRGAVVSRSR